MKISRAEFAALVMLGLIVVGLPAAALGYEYWLRPTTVEHRVIDIKSFAPEAGGFSPDAIRVPVGEPVTLRFASMDVTHGVAIGPGLGIDLGHIDPGQMSEITVTFDRPGTYTYYCTTWCSPDHWRMRGTIQVFDPAAPNAVSPAQPDPVIAALIAEGVDIDAAHQVPGTHGRSSSTPALVIERTPSAQRGAHLLDTLALPAEVVDPLWRRSHTPVQALDRLAAANPGIPQADLLDVVAHLWTREATPERLAAAEALYNSSCAACHGQQGGGDGPAANTTPEKPVAFADAAYLFERRSDVLYAKIRRGGMGTGMPNFGTLLTPDETWMLVEYLWTMPVEAPHQAP